MTKNSTAKYGILAFIALFVFLAIFLYIIEIARPYQVFELMRYIKNLIISFSFLVLIAWIDYKSIIRINNAQWLKKNLFLRIVIEGTILSLLAGLFVIIGNMPFQYQRNIWEYIISTSYKEGLIASILLNLFTIIVIEFFVHSEQTHKLEKDISKMQYQQLKDQINPHFLFNSLNVLVSLINKDTERATDYTKKLSAIYRYVLTHDLEETVFIEKELEFIRNYLDILKIRFGNGLNVEYKICNDDLQKKIPPMTLQILVENAVKHNAITPSTPLIIQIKSNHQNIIVSNNLIPRMRVNSSFGIGLKNIKDKYAILSNKSIDIYKNEHEFTVKLPLL